ncbi:MAG: hypothetical protein EXQ48_04785 [Acidobacteria bacterium]|nr:hypothetical protein [Acidobacteriota bacterium]
MRTTCATLIAVMGIAAATAGAHHSWTAEYDGGKAVTVKGTIVKVEWTNPHTHFYVEAKDGSGTVTVWNFEMASTLALERAGWTRRTLQVGDQVTIGGYAGRKVIEHAIASTMLTADGRELFVGKPGQ